MQAILDSIVKLLPSGVDWYAFGRFLLYAAAAILIAGAIGKLIFGIGSQMNKAICGAVGILFVYALAMVLYTFLPEKTGSILSTLPLVSFSNRGMYLFSFLGSDLNTCCRQLLSVWILSYLFNMLDDFMPRGEKLYWLIYRLLTIAMALVLHYALYRVLKTFVPAYIVSYASTALLIALVLLFSMGILKVVLSVILTVTNPILGALYLFFFGSKPGKQLSRAFLTALILCILSFILLHTGHGVIPISQSALIGYIPFALLLVLLWWIVGYVF